MGHPALSTFLEAGFFFSPAFLSGVSVVEIMTSEAIRHVVVDQHKTSQRRLKCSDPQRHTDVKDTLK